MDEETFKVKEQLDRLERHSVEEQWRIIKNIQRLVQAKYNELDSRLTERWLNS